MKITFINDFIGLFYPRVCLACGEVLMSYEETVCTTCRYLLPKTRYESLSDNPLSRMFRGQVPFKAVTSEFFFSKDGKIQSLMHNLKYKGETDAGLFLGQELGKSLHQSPLFNDADCLIPIPLHPKKEKTRGYNQSRVIAEGIAKETGLDIADECLFRKVYTETQTHKGRNERLKNVSGVFGLHNSDSLKGKHVILIDDVLTTGATMLSAGAALFSIPDIVISIATAACATN